MTVREENRLAGCLAVLQLELEARQARTLEGLVFLMVNRTLSVLPATTAVLWAGERGGRGRIEGASGIAEMDVNAPFIVWMRRVLAVLAAREDAAQARAVAGGDLERDDGDAWAEWSPPCALWCPVVTADGVFFGGLWLVRERPWEPGEIALAQRLGGAFAQSWALLAPSGVSRRNRRVSGRFLAWSGLVLAMVGGFVPMRQSVLAPATVVARDPVVVTAPLDGVIDRIEVSANAPVHSGEILFRMQQQEIRNRRDVAEMALGVAQAKRLKAQKLSFSDPEAKAGLPLLEAQARQRAAELDHAAELLERTLVRARSGGIAIFGNPGDWSGRPVQVGERVMIIADPDQAELEIRLPVADAILMDPGAPVRLFLNTDPLHPLAAELQHAGFEAELTAEGLLAYRLTARFIGNDPVPRIGLKGTARITGGEIPLFYHLFRRPLTALRQAVGF